MKTYNYYLYEQLQIAGNISSRFSINSEASGSELLENFEEMSLQYCMYTLNHDHLSWSEPELICTPHSSQLHHIFFWKHLTRDHIFSRFEYSIKQRRSLQSILSELYLPILLYDPTFHKMLPKYCIFFIFRVDVFLRVVMNASQSQ